MTQTPTNLARRGFLLGGAALGAGAAARRLHQQRAAGSPATQRPGRARRGSGNDAPGKKVVIGFSAPAADHGWIAAITNNAKARPAAVLRREFKPVEADQRRQPADRRGRDADRGRRSTRIVMLPARRQGSSTQVGAQGHAGRHPGRQPRPGVPRHAGATAPGSAATTTAWASRPGTTSASSSRTRAWPTRSSGRSRASTTLPLTQERSKGFDDALKTYGFKVSQRRSAEFTVESGPGGGGQPAAGAPKIDAIWNHDDDQGIGVLAAIKQANRNEFFMVGGAGSQNAMERRSRPTTRVLKATVTYSPTMASSAITLARLIAQGKGMSDLVELQVPKSITLASETITKENVDKYLPLGFES